MLITTRPLNCFGKLVQAGQPIPDPEKWNRSALQSNINLGWVKEATAEEAEEIRKAAELTPPPQPSAFKRRGARSTEKESLRCPHCPDREFETSKSLKAHQARSHRK